MGQKTWTERPKPDEHRARRLSLRISDVDIARLVSDYEAGLSGRQLAQKYGLGRSTVLKLLREHGVAVRYPRLTEAECARVVELYRQGMRQIDIAEQFGRHKAVIWHVLRRAGAL